MIKNDELEFTSLVITVVTLTVVVVCTCAARYLAVLCSSITDIRMTVKVEGTDVGSFDGTYDGGIDGIWEGEDDGEGKGKDDGDMEGEIIVEMGAVSTIASLYSFAKVDGAALGLLDGVSDGRIVGDCVGDLVLHVLNVIPV